MSSAEPEHRRRPREKGAGAANPPWQRRWESSVEQQIAEARERGVFDNLQGQGQPLRLERNPFAKEKALAYSLLKNNQMAPPEIERGKEIAEDLKRADALLDRLRFQRDRLRSRGAVFDSDRRSYQLLVAGTEQRYKEALTDVNRKILTLNISTPAPLHQRMINIEARIQAFHCEFSLEETT